MKRSIALFASTVLTLSLLGAQQPQDPGKTTVEDVYLRQAVQVTQMQRLLENSDRDSKLNALEIVGEMVEKEVGDDTKKNKGPLSLGNNQVLMGLVSEMASEGTNREIRVNNRLLNDYPDVRRKAAEYLGIIKGDKSREILVGMVKNEKEPMVLAEIVYSLGLVGSDESGKTEVTISSIVKTQDVVRPDNNLAYASISAIRKIGETKGASKVQPELFDALIRIAQGNYIRSVRDEAKKLMDCFRKDFKNCD